jgi:hypothetical protein
VKGDLRTEGEEVRTMNACMFAHCQFLKSYIGNGDDFETKNANDI